MKPIALPITTRKYGRQIVIAAVAVLMLLLLMVMMGSTLKTRGPFKAVYLKYSKWKYDWRSPSDLGDGKHALQVIIESPMGIAEDLFTNIYVTDRATRMIWKLEPSGRAIVIAGTGKTTGPDGLPRPGALALDIDFASPEGIVVEKNGNLLVADSLNHAILRIDLNGYLTPVAGNGERGFSGDGIKATESSLFAPYDVRVDSKGNIYVADVLNHRIRKIDENGLISTVAGTGQPGYSGDGGPAVKAQLNMPYGILLDVNDNLLIADSDNNVIRKVGSDGIIQTIAGNGQRGYEGDGGAAKSARFDSPQSLALDQKGRLYIGDEHNNAIRIIEPDGRINTLVGTRGPGFSGDGGPALLAQIADPENLWVRHDGTLLISVRDNSRLRMISPAGIISTVAGRGPTSRHNYYAPISLPTVEQ